MTARRITVELTEAQYDALCGAVAEAECNWQAEYDDDPSRNRGRLLALDNAWTKLNRAWHARARRRS